MRTQHTTAASIPEQFQGIGCLWVESDAARLVIDPAGHQILGRSSGLRDLRLGGTDHHSVRRAAFEPSGKQHIDHTTCPLVQGTPQRDREADDRSHCPDRFNPGFESLVTPQSPLLVGLEADPLQIQ